MLPYLTKSKERETQFVFSHHTTDANLYYFIKDDFKSPSGLKNATIALIKNYEPNKVVKKQYPNSTIILVDTWLEGLELVQKGKADAFMQVYSSVHRYLKDKKITNIKPYLPAENGIHIKLHMATTKAKKPLINIINKALILANFNEIEAIKDKWKHKLDIDENNKASSISFTAEEEAWLDAHPNIRFLGAKDAKPYEWFDEKGDFSGIVADGLRLLDNKLPSEFSYELVTNKQDALHDLDVGTVDFIAAQFAKDHPEKYLFTQPLVTTPVVMLMREEVPFVDNITYLYGKKVALLEDSQFKQQIMSDHPQIDLVFVKDYEDGIASVASKDVDAFLGGMLSMTYHQNNFSGHNIHIVGKTNYKIDLKFAINKKNAPLYSILNKAKNKVTVGEQQRLLKNWGHQAFASKTDYRLALQILATGFGLLLFSLFWIRKLNKQIELRQAEVALRNQEVQLKNQEIIKRESSEQSLAHANQRLQLANEVVGLSVCEFLFDDNGNICVLETELGADTDLKVETSNSYKSYDKLLNNVGLVSKTAKEKKYTYGAGSLKDDWITKIINKTEFLECLNTVRKTKNKANIEVKVLPSNANQQHSYLTKYIAMVYDQSTEKDKVIATMWDISHIKSTENALKLANEKAEDANRAKSEFLANMSHEIRTPMNVILGYTELLTEKITDPQQHHVLNTINSAGRDLLVLINDILDLSKIEAGKLSINKTACDVRKVIKDVNNIFALKIEEKGLKQSIKIASDIPSTLFLDEVRTRQILVNLVGNAIKFTKEGSIDISLVLLHQNTHESKVNIAIDVTDTGIGMHPETALKVFDKFEQASNHSAREYEGAGLGLAISKQLANMMGGDLTVTSEIDKGSNFRLTLNDIDIASISTEANNQTNLSSDQTINFKPATILTVDDIENNRELIKNVFKETDLTVLSASNGEEAIKIVQEQHLDLIFMDIYMPKKDGYQATREIKAIKDIPVVVLTASVMDEYELADRAIFDGFLTKPVKKEDLYSQMKQHLCYEVVENTNEPITDKVNHTIVNVSPETIFQEKENAKKVFAMLTNMQPESTKLASANDISGTKDFVEKLSTIQNSCPNTVLNRYIMSFNDKINQVDLLAMIEQLNSFDNLINQIQTTYDL